MSHINDELACLQIIVTNPRRPRAVVQVLLANKDKLIPFLEGFLEDRSECRLGLSRSCTGQLTRAGMSVSALLCNPCLMSAMHTSGLWHCWGLLGSVALQPWMEAAMGDNSSALCLAGTLALELLAKLNTQCGATAGRR